MSKKIQIPEDIAKVEFSEATKDSPVLGKFFGRCRFPYEIGNIFEKMSDEDRYTVISTAAEERNAKILWSLECAVGSFGDYAACLAYLEVMEYEAVQSTLFNMSHRNDSAILGLVAFYTQCPAILTRLASDDSELVRQAVLLNPHTPEEAHLRCGRPKGYVRVGQFSDVRETVKSAVKDGKLSPEPLSAHWGSGVFRVNCDGSYQLYRSNYDSSG